MPLNLADLDFHCCLTKRFSLTRSEESAIQTISEVEKTEIQRDFQSPLPPHSKP